jgi:hypothetical protein
MKISTINSSAVDWALGEAKFVPREARVLGRINSGIPDSVARGWRAYRVRLEPADTSLATAVGDRSVAQARNDLVSSWASAPVAASTRYILQ